MKSRSIIYILFYISFFILGCGGDSTSIYPLNDLRRPTNNGPQFPNIFRKAGQTDVEYFLEQFFQFCETDNQDVNYPFCLALDFKTIRSILSPKINEWKNFSKHKFISAFNKWAQDYGYLSHLYLKANTRKNNLNFKGPKNFNFQKDDQVTYLYIYDFAESYIPSIIQKKMYEANKTGKIIINLRNNRGGRQDNLEHLLSFFFPSGTQYGFAATREQQNLLSATDYQNHRDYNYLHKIVQKISDCLYHEVVPNHNNPLFNGKIALLVNEGTGSSAEILTYTLINLKGVDVRVFGQPTPGKVQGALTVTVPVLNAELTYPVAEFFTLNYKFLEGYNIPINEDTYGEETSLQKATDWLQF